MIVRSLLSATLLTLLVAACGSPGASPSAGPSDAAPLDPTGAWQLTEGTVDGTPVPIIAGHRVTAILEGRRISGVSACNHYGAELEVVGGEVQVGVVGMTEMACGGDGVMELEAQYVAAIHRVRAITVEGAELVMSGPDVELRFERLELPPAAELLDTTWVLETLITGGVASAPEGDRATLEIRSDGTFIGSTGCRSFAGEWMERGDEIITPSWGAEGECPIRLQPQDSLVVSVIGDGVVPSVDGDRLTLADENGDQLVYRAED